MNPVHTFVEIPNVKEFTISLFFNLTRKNDDAHAESIHDKLQTILSYFKKQLDTPQPPQKIKDITHELNVLFKLALYTRDCICGLNERKLAFVQLCAWYSVFPKQAIYIARFFLLGNNANQPFGSWNDVKHLCLYIKDTHPNIKYLIDDILTITHNETVKLYEHSIHDADTDENKNKCHKTYFISNTLLSKTTPSLAHTRELHSYLHTYNNLPNSIPPETSKKYKWIFSILAEMWGEYAFEYTNDLNASYHTIIKIHKKYKMVYRNTMKLLKNKNLKTSHKITSTETQNRDFQENFIPIVDLSAFSVKADTSAKYKHIDILKHISPHSSIDKIICVNNAVSVIDRENIDSIATTTEHTYPDYFKAIDLLIESFKESNISNHEFALLKLIFISNLGTDETNPATIYNYLSKKFKNEFRGQQLPIIVFWNISNENTPYFSNTDLEIKEKDKHFTDDGENITLTDNIIFTSGLSIYSKNILHTHITNTYQHITDILAQPRYQCDILF